MDEGVILAVAGIVIGSAVTWFVSRWYYQKGLRVSAASNAELKASNAELKASNDELTASNAELKGEIRELRQSFAVITRAMEQDGTLARAMQRGGFTIRRNEAGEAIGLAYGRSLQVNVPSSATVEAKVVRARDLSSSIPNQASLGHTVKRANEGDSAAPNSPDGKA